MSKPIVMSPRSWAVILEKIKQREKPSVYLTRSKMKEVLGFTVREHREWVKDPEYVKQSNKSNEWWDMDIEGWYEGKRSEFTIRLDFYDEEKRTMFLLRYGNGRD